MDANQVMIPVLNIGRTFQEKIEGVKAQCDNVLVLCQHTRAGIPAERAQEMLQRSQTAQLFLDWLETSLDMSPHIRHGTGIEAALSSLQSRDNNMPAEMATRAGALLEKYQGERWGHNAVAHRSAANVPAAQVPGAADPAAVVQQPPDDFAENGIMYGLQVNAGGKRSYTLRRDLQQTSAKAYGHNGIAVGTWYPYQISALFWGAHGASNAGIAGNAETGAWSIIVSGAYEDLDGDEGETLYYSGANSHNNEDPAQVAPASQGTRALQASLRTRRPVRVLRSGNKARHQNLYLPSCGLRYDGLYRVATVRHLLNRRGGLYEQFQLVRLPNQVPLQQLQNTSPTAEEIAAYNRVAGRN